MSLCNSGGETRLPLNCTPIILRQASQPVSAHSTALSDECEPSGVDCTSPAFRVSVRSCCPAAYREGLVVSALDSGHYGVLGGAANEVVSRIWWKFPICVLRVGSWLALSGCQVKGFGGYWLRQGLPPVDFPHHDLA